MDGSNAWTYVTLSGVSSRRYNLYWVLTRVGLIHRNEQPEQLAVDIWKIWITWPCPLVLNPKQYVGRRVGWMIHSSPRGTACRWLHPASVALFQRHRRIILDSSLKQSNAVVMFKRRKGGGWVYREWWCEEDSIARGSVCAKQAIVGSAEQEMVFST